MGGSAGFNGFRAWFWCALTAAICALPTPAAARARLSDSVSLFGDGPAPNTLPMVLACTPSQCAAFYSDSEAHHRVGGVLLDALGAPIESTRVDFGRSNGALRAAAAGDRFVLSFADPASASSLRVLLVDSNTLAVMRDLSSSESGRMVRAMHSDGKTVVLLDFTLDDVATIIDLESGAVVGKQPIVDFWEPVVIPGPDQYLLFYPTYGSYGRLSSTTGAWLGAGGAVAPDLIDAFEGSGYFRDGTYQLIWRHVDPLTAHQTAQMFGMRVNAADGKALDLDTDGKPAPTVLCNECPSAVKGALQIGGANYFWFAKSNDEQPLLEINPTTGRRANPSLSGADTSISASPAIDVVSPSIEPRLLSAGGAIYAANTADLGHFFAGAPQLPGLTSSVRPTTLHAASNADGFVVVWQSREVTRASRVAAKARPDFGVDGVSTQELGFPGLEDLAVASAGGQYLIAGVHESDSHELELMWRVLDASGKLGPLNTESTGLTLTSSKGASVRIGSDGERYLVALFSGSFIDADGILVAQRFSAEGVAQEPLTTVVTGITLLDSVDANFASPESARRFALTYRTLEGNAFSSYLLTTPVSGKLTFETTALSPFQYVLANDGQSLLLGGAATLNLARNPLVPRAVPTDDLSGLSHWNGRAYIRLTNASPRLTVNQISAEDFKAHDEELQVTSELVGSYQIAVGDGKGRSLLAYFASEGPGHVVALRATLLETASEPPTGEGGAAGEGGEGGSSGHAGMPGELGPVGGTANVAGAASRMGDAGSTADAGASQRDGGPGPLGSNDDSRSRACGCSLPGLARSNSGISLLALLALALRRRRSRTPRVAA